METGAGFMCALCACVVEGQVIRRSSPVEGKCNVKVLVVVTHLVPWTVAHQAPLSLGFSRQEYWRRVSIPFSRGSSQHKDQICEDTFSFMFNE